MELALFFLFLFSLSLSFVSLFLSLHSLRRVSHRVTLQKNLSLIRGYVYIHVQRNKKKRGGSSLDRANTRENGKRGNLFRTIELHTGKN